MLDWADKRRGEPKAPKTPKIKETDPIAELLKFHRQFDEYQKFLKDQEKLNKKEEKTEEKKGWEALSFIQKFTFLTFSVPLVMMAQTLLLLSFMKIVGNLTH